MAGKGLSSPTSGRRVSSTDSATRRVRTQFLHAEIGAPHPIVGGQGPMRAFENDPTGFKHLPVVAGFQSFRYTLLHQKQRDAVLAVECRDAVEDQVGDGGSEPHRGFVETKHL